MTWAKLDDRFHENRKIRGLWRKQPAALGLHVLALTYCAGNETDGFVDAEFVADKAGSPATHRKMTTALVDAGMWIEEPGGWRLHDYLDYNPSSAQLAQTRGVDRFRKDLTRDHALIDRIRRRDGDICRYCGVQVNWKDRKSNVGGTYDHVIPVSQGGENTYDNVVVACRGCNCRKQARTPDAAAMPLRDPPGSSPGPDKSTAGQMDQPAISDSRPDPSRPDPYPTSAAADAGEHADVMAILRAGIGTDIDHLDAAVLSLMAANPTPHRPHVDVAHDLVARFQAGQMRTSNYIGFMATLYQQRARPRTQLAAVDDVSPEDMAAIVAFRKKAEAEADRLKAQRKGAA